MKILIIEDDHKIIELVTRTLRTAWVEVNSISTFWDFISIIKPAFNLLRST